MTFMDSFLEHASEQYFSSGILYAHYHWCPVGRSPHGQAFWNFPSGKRMVEGYYNKGIRAGRWKWFTEDGEVIKIEELGEGEYIKSQHPEQFDFGLITPENTILLEEEYGYKEWFWQPDRPIEEILVWWSNLDAVSPWTSSPSLYLPGIFIEAEGESYSLYSNAFKSGRYHTGHINEDDDSFLKKPSGEMVYHKHYELVEREGLC